MGYFGCLTSKEWPPKPYKRYLVTSERIKITRPDGTVYVTLPVEDYMWVWPGDVGQKTSGGPGTKWHEEASPWQELAIRQMEEG